LFKHGANLAFGHVKKLIIVRQAMALVYFTTMQNPVLAVFGACTGFASRLGGYLAVY